MAKPYYFQTEDEKRMAAIRANPSGRPVQMAPRWSAPKEQITSKDSQMAILKKYGGTQPIQGSDNRPSGVFNERGERVESDNRSPGVWENGKRISPYRPPTAPIAPTSNWQQDIIKQYPDIGKEGTPMQQKFVSISKWNKDNKVVIDPFALASYVKNEYGPGTPGAAMVGDFSAPTGPTPQDIADMEKAGTADMSPRFSPIEMRKSTLNAWQSGSLAPLIDKTEPYGTALNDRPGRGRSFENLSRPMGMGMLPQRPTSTAPGASERVAERRAIRMNPKSSEADRRWAKGIGGARNTSYGNYD